MEQQQGFSTERISSGNWANFKDGKIIHNGKAFEGLTGRVVELDLTDEVYLGKDYKKLTLFVQVNGEIFRLGFPLFSGYGIAFLSISPNVDWDKDITISGLCEPDEDGKKKASLFIRQDGKPVKWFWTKDKPGKVPQPVKLKGGGWDFAKRNDWLMEYLEKKLRMNIVKLNVNVKVDKTRPVKRNNVKIETTGTTDTTDEALDDLPF